MDCQSPWFENWFDRNYLLLYRHRDLRDAAAQVRLILSEIAPEEGWRILDLACGDGRHTHLFRRLGFAVMGVDLSLELLREGKRRYGGLPLAQGDMRAIPGRFHLILSLFTSFGYLETRRENLDVLRSIARALLPGGFFWLDYLNPEHVRVHLEAETLNQVSSGCRVRERRRIRDGRIEKEIVFFQAEGERTYLESVALYSRADLEDMMTEAGLMPCGAFGDYLGGAWTGRSPRTVLYARRGE